MRAILEVRALAIGLATLAILAAGCGASHTEAAAPSASDETGPAATTEAASDASACSEERFTSMGRDHVEEAPPESAYNSSPPTSGPHHPSPARWNAYPMEIPQFVLVHNLEHGGIVVQYGDRVPPEEVDAILDWYRADPYGIVVAPYPKLGGRIAVAAWTHLLTCSRFDEQAFAAFRDRYRYEGPELLPEDRYEPGV